MSTPLQKLPVAWPAETQRLFHRAITVDYASLTRSGAPVTSPVTPYVGESGMTLDVATGLTYPAKAERARRNPRVALLYADAQGSGISDAPVVLVQGLATVRDADLQATTDRYVRDSSARFPDSFRGTPDFVVRRLQWYLARIWIEVTPTRVVWWPHGDLDAAPETWVNSAVGSVPASDPAPGPRTTSATAPPATRDWRDVAADTVDVFPHRSLTTVDEDGYPSAVPLRGARVVEGGIALDLPAGVGRLVRPGHACVTVHDHDDAFSFQRNATFVGRVGDDHVLHVDRAMDALQLPPRGLRRLKELSSWKKRYAPRVADEARRRGQAVPVVRTELLTRR